MHTPLGRDLGLGLIGSGFMGRAHALGFLNANRVFDLPVSVTLEMLADLGEARAQAAARAFGFRRATGDWRALVADPAIHLVAIATPNQLHREMALAAIAAGKHVYCEKPLATTLSDARAMQAAAEAAGVVTAVGFNYVKNPMIRLARDIIQSGEIGEIRSFRGIHAEDFMMDASVPWGWRLDPAEGGGALADIGSHIIALARFLLGPITRVMGDIETAVRARPVAAGATETRPVPVEDIARAHLRFASGATGGIEANWLASGRKMQLDFEIAGSKGGIVFTQERFNELKVFTAEGPASRRGFRTILAGPEHPPYRDFCIAGGHQIGFNDLKTIEVRDFLRAVAGDATDNLDFGEGVAVLAVMEAIYASAREEGWVTVG